jgi:NAD(P)-dependent dehydrogenase (short-subunit alcohol dehydrogenase family)
MNYLEKYNLKNKTAFVIGGSGLIGSEVSKALFELGAKVIVIDKVKNNNISHDKERLRYYKFDISKIDKLEFNFKELVKKHGVPDIFINSSYPRTKDWKNNSFKKIKYSSFSENLKIHLNTFSWLSKLVADSMAKNNKNGTIIQLSSIYGIVGQNLEIYKETKMSESMTYSVIKGGINNLTRQMSSYYGKYGIRINSLCAGGVFDNQNKLFVKNYKKIVPLKRMANSDEIASVIAFLSSDASSYITGSMIMVDGGWTAI